MLRRTHAAPLVRAVATPARVAAAPATPALAVWTASERTRLRTQLHAAFAPALDGADRWSLAVFDARGRAIFEDHDTTAATPASVQKLIVASVALDLLGPAYRFDTIAAAQAPIAAGGVLAGNLWIAGSGDPSLRSGDLASGVAALQRAGLRHITGSVAVDASALRGPEINPYWDSADANEDYDAPTSAISLDEDTAEFRVYGRAPGQAARVVVLPASDAIHLRGAIETSNASDDVIIAADLTPNHFRLDGAIPAGVEEKFWLPVHGIPRYVGDVFQRMLHDRGISTGAQPIVEPAPLQTSVLWDHRSADLRTLERHMLYVSDNHYAEQLLRVVGWQDGSAADDRGGIATEWRFLRQHHIPTPGLHVVDGSGLARVNRVSALTIASVLAYDESRGPLHSLYDLLPQGGRDGTLTGYDFTEALGRVRAKTGHITGVSSLAGYVNTRHHGRVIFAFLINGSPGDPDSAIVRAVDRISTF
ncbi:MAG: D-alanyl-D-alanine carboxypeptidase/D-alanyl-D-alanine endopeptidase [Vulcanimicrobiaceae bacterium]